MNIGRMLWDFGINFLQAIQEVWSFLTTRIEVGKLEIFGIELIQGFSFTPLMLTGGFMLTILGIGLLSLFNPFS